MNEAELTPMPGSPVAEAVKLPELIGEAVLREMQRLSNELAATKYELEHARAEVAWCGGKLKAYEGNS